MLKYVDFFPSKCLINRCLNLEMKKIKDFTTTFIKIEILVFLIYKVFSKCHTDNTNKFNLMY
jgi:hypothetical protein